MSFSIHLETTGVSTPLGARTQYPCLIVEASPHADELSLQFILLSDNVSIGRSTDCTLALKDPGISRRHTTLSIEPGPSGRDPVVRISNLSHQGDATRIGDKTLGSNSAGVLRLGEVLRLGSTCLRYGLLELEPQIIQVLKTVAELMRKAHYDKALGGLAALKRYRPLGGSRRTSLEQLLLSAQFLEARIHCVLGKWGMAIDLLEELIGPENPDEELRLKATFQLAFLSVQQNDLERALTLVERMWELAEGRDGYFLALALCLRGMTAARLRDFALARRAFRDASARLQHSTRPTQNLSARILLELGISHFLAEQHDLALELFGRLKKEDGHGEPYQVICAEALRYRAVIHSLRRDFEKADALLREALKTFQEAKWHFLECKAQKSRALNYLSWGRIEEASVHLQLCHELLTHDVENEYERAVCAGQLGKVYLTRGDAHEALRWFEQERQLQAGIPGVAHSQAYTHRNFARAHRNLGNAGEAALYYVRAVETFHEFSNWVQKGLTLVELCRHRMDAGEVEQAAAALVDAEASFLAAGRGPGFEATLNVLRAQLAWARGEVARAQELFAQSLRAMESSPPSYLLAEVYLFSGRLHVELHRRATQAQDTAAAAAHYRQAMLLIERGSECATSQGLGWLLEQFRKESEKLDHKEFTKLFMRPFVPRELLEHLEHSSLGELNKFQLDERTVIFVDLSGYTALVEREDLAGVRDILNEFYGFATRTIQHYGGAVDKFIGDCVMAIFRGDITGLGLQNQAVAAVSAAVDIIREVEVLSERRFGDTRRLAASAGVCTGKLLTGLVGSLQQMNFTCIGDVVNVASRLQGLARPGEVLIAHETYQACMQGGTVLWVDGDLREARVKNRVQPVRYWSLDRVTRATGLTVAPQRER